MDGYTWCTNTHAPGVSTLYRIWLAALVSGKTYCKETCTRNSALINLFQLQKETQHSPRGQLLPMLRGRCKTFVEYIHGWHSMCIVRQSLVRGILAIWYIDKTDSHYLSTRNVYEILFSGTVLCNSKSQKKRDWHYNTRHSLVAWSPHRHHGWCRRFRMRRCSRRLSGKDN